MRKVIKSSANKSIGESKKAIKASMSARNEVDDLLDKLQLELGVSDETILDHVVRWFDAYDMSLCLANLIDEITY